jgi:hypothetical protein
MELAGWNWPDDNARTRMSQQKVSNELLNINNTGG